MGLLFARLLVQHICLSTVVFAGRQICRFRWTSANRYRLRGSFFYFDRIIGNGPPELGNHDKDLENRKRFRLRIEPLDEDLILPSKKTRLMMMASFDVSARFCQQIL